MRGVRWGKDLGVLLCGLVGFLKNYRRDGYDFDALYDDGKAPNKHKKIMVNFMEDNADSEIYSNELKKQAGFGKDGEKGFDGAIRKTRAMI